TAKLRRADAEFVHRHTGQRIGGVAPVAHPRPLRTLVDVALADYPQVWAAGGIPHAVFPTTFDELVALTGGEPAEVAWRPAGTAPSTYEVRRAPGDDGRAHRRLERSPVRRTRRRGDADLREGDAVSRAHRGAARGQRPQAHLVAGLRLPGGA